MLLDVLDLLAELFQLGFELDDFARDLSVLRFGADGVDFTIHFLRQKIAHRVNFGEICDKAVLLKGQHAELDVSGLTANIQCRCRDPKKTAPIEGKFLHPYP